MKREILVSAFLLLIANTGFASPLTDYSQGKVAVDITWQSPKIHENYSVDGNSYDYDKKNNISYGITAGLGNKFAFQYKQSNPESKDTLYGSVDPKTGDFTTQKEKLQVREYNVLYKLTKNISTFTGIAQVKSDLSVNSTLEGGSSSDSTSKKNIWQFGLVGTVPVADKTNAYAVAAIGSDLTAWKLGLGYELEKNLDLDVFYSYSQYKNLQWQAGGSSDFTVKGMGYGVTYKF